MSKWFNKPNGIYCFFCCFSSSNNIFNCFYLVFKKIINTNLLENINVW